MSTNDIASLAGEARAYADMIISRQPGMRDAVEEAMADLADELAEIFRPHIDLAEGRITADEFLAEMAVRAERSLAERLAKWGPPDDPDDPVWDVNCDECGASISFEDEPPPLDPLCESCEDAENEDDEDEDDNW